MASLRTYVDYRTVRYSSLFQNVAPLLEQNVAPLPLLGQNVAPLPEQNVAPLPEQYITGAITGVSNNVILEKSFGNYLKFIQDFKTDMNKEILKQPETYLEPTWIKCQKTCQNITVAAIQKEVNSTAFIIRCLIKSMINEPLDISCSDPSKITGLWKKDSGLFTMDNFSGQQQGRLIMGFGPSASGKTYWAKNTINMLSEIESGFPSTFMTIDGGIYRESSVIYQILVKCVISRNVGGLTNLVSSGLWSKSLFSAGKIKKTIADFLKTQSPPNLYIPETLGSCVVGMSTKGTCLNMYNKYKIITGDNDWIGLCIWQHVEDTKCIFAPQYKCIGCTESGQKRERGEGKHYSPLAYNNSFKYGKIHAKKAKKWFIIHNTGGRMYKNKQCINLIESNIQISKKLQEQFNCKQLESGFSK